ncbi:MAG TPA: hypothetical protein VG206_03790 [Terriglobia bacterium]|nr:hypothetical protein [Terriglobia bacterium]
MPHSQVTATKRDRRGAKTGRRKLELRYTVSLPPGLAHRVERYAETVDTSRSKAIAALVRFGLDGQENRKREFFKRLRQNLAGGDPQNEDQLVDEFRALILGC